MPASRRASLTADRRHWYKRLKAEGFVDIETGANHDGLLTRDLPRMSGERTFELELTGEYFSLAARYLQLIPIPDDLDRRIWELHATENLSYRDIADRLGTYTRRVNDTVNRLRTDMLNAVKPVKAGNTEVGDNPTRSMGEVDPKALLDGAMGLIKEQLEQLRDHSAKRLLEKAEADSLCNYAKVLLSAAKDQRQEDDEDLGEYTPEQLRERIKRLAGEVL